MKKNIGRKIGRRILTSGRWPEKIEAEGRVGWPDNSNLKIRTFFIKHTSAQMPYRYLLNLCKFVIRCTMCAKGVLAGGPGEESPDVILTISLEVTPHKI